MSSTLLTVALSTVLGAGPYGYGVPEYSGGYGDVGYAGTGGDQMYPYDSPEPWLRGYLQHMPSYGGFQSFRPYNYRHVIAQAQTAGGWGMPVNMPYSQQFWHRYQKQAGLQPRQSQPQPQTNIQQQLSQISAIAYAAEMARLAALRNQQYSQQMQNSQYAPPPSAPPRQLNTGYPPASPNPALAAARQ